MFIWQKQHTSSLTRKTEIYLNTYIQMSTICTIDSPQHRCRAPQAEASLGRLVIDNMLSMTWRNSNLVQFTYCEDATHKLLTFVDT